MFNLAILHSDYMKGCLLPGIIFYEDGRSYLYTRRTNRTKGARLRRKYTCFQYNYAMLLPIWKDLHLSNYLFSYSMLMKSLTFFNQCSTYGKTRWMAFASKMCEKHLWQTDILKKDAGHLYLKCHSSTSVFHTLC